MDYYRTIEIIVELINNKNFNKNICFEMNALPIIMTFLIARQYNKENNLKKKFPSYFDFEEKVKRQIEKEEKEKGGKKKEEKKEEEDEQKKKDKEKEKRINLFKKIFDVRIKYINKSFKLEGFKKNKITLKNNSIKNKLENYDYLLTKKPDFDSNKIEKKDFGKDIFNLDIDYKYFFIKNHNHDINFENCLFSNEDEIIYQINQNKIEETIKNLIQKSEIENKKNYKFDIPTLNEILFKNKKILNLSFLLKYFSIKENDEIDSDTYTYLKRLESFFQNLKNIFDTFKNSANITIKFNNIKEKKEFYCILCLLKVKSEGKSFKKILEEKNQKNEYKENVNINLPNSDELKKILKPYFLKTKIKVKDDNNNNIEEEWSCVFDYYNTTEGEKKIFGDFETKLNEIKFEEYQFKIEYNFKDQWDIIIK